MSYEIRITPKAEAVLDSLPPHLLRATVDHLDRLGQHPAAYSRPMPSFPFASDYGMISEFDGPCGEGAWEHLVVHFRYSQDETAIIVGEIGHWPLDANAPIREL